MPSIFIMWCRHPDWECKGKRNVTREPEKGSRHATFADYKNSLINDSIPFLCLLPSFNHFLPFVLPMRDDDVLPLLPILQSEPIRAASQCRNFFKYGPVTTEKRKKKKLGNQSSGLQRLSKARPSLTVGLVVEWVPGPLATKMRVFRCSMLIMGPMRRRGNEVMCVTVVVCKQTSWYPVVLPLSNFQQPCTSSVEWLVFVAWVDRVAF